MFSLTLISNKQNKFILSSLILHTTHLCLIGSFNLLTFQIKRFIRKKKIIILIRHLSLPFYFLPYQLGLFFFGFKVFIKLSIIADVTIAFLGPTNVFVIYLPRIKNERLIYIFNHRSQYGKFIYWPWFCGTWLRSI